MSTYEIKSNLFLLKIDAENLKYSVILNSGKEWTITKKPYICFESGKIIEFPKPKEVIVTNTGTFDGVRSFYDLPETEISIMTHVYIDRTTNDLMFEVLVTGDKPGEINTVSYPAPFDFDAKEGEGYTILPRMQGTLSCDFGSFYLVFFVHMRIEKIRQHVGIR